MPDGAGGLSPRREVGASSVDPVLCSSPPCPATLRAVSLVCRSRGPGFRVQSPESRAIFRAFGPRGLGLWPKGLGPRVLGAFRGGVKGEGSRATGHGPRVAWAQCPVRPEHLSTPARPYCFFLDFVIAPWPLAVLHPTSYHPSHFGRSAFGHSAIPNPQPPNS